MANYDINGTIVYNPDFKNRFGVSSYSSVAAAWLALLEPRANLAERETVLWREHLKDSRALARSGAVLALAIRPGRLAARVEHPASKETHAVKISAPPVAPSVWAELAAHAAREAQLAARIAEGALPEVLLLPLVLTRDDVTFEADGTVLSSKQAPQSLMTTAWLAFAERIHNDPWLWVLFRGQTQTGLLDLIRVQSRARAAQQASAQGPAHQFKLEKFWTMGELPPVSSTHTGPPRVLAQLSESAVGIRVGRRSLAQVLVKAMQQK
jgi:uncharacterized Zn finger protein